MGAWDDVHTCAGKAQYQYGQAGSMTAMRRGEMAHSADATRTSHMAGMRWMKYPVAKLRMMPTMRLGRMRREACRAERCWISWKLARSLEG